MEESCVHCTVACCAFSSTEETRVEEKLPAQLERRTPQLGLWWLHWVHLLRCPSKIFRHWNKKTILLVMVYSAQFNNVFKALNLFLYTIPQYSSFQLSIFAQTLGMASPFNLPSQWKTCSSTPFLKLIWARWQSGQYSGLCVLYFCSPCTLCLPHEWKDGKRERSSVYKYRSLLVSSLFKGAKWVESAKQRVCHNAPWHLKPMGHD